MCDNVLFMAAGFNTELLNQVCYHFFLFPVILQEAIYFQSLIKNYL